MSATRFYTPVDYIPTSQLYNSSFIAINSILRIIIIGGGPETDVVIAPLEIDRYVKPRVHGFTFGGGGGGGPGDGSSDSM